MNDDENNAGEYVCRKDVEGGTAGTPVAEWSRHCGLRSPGRTGLHRSTSKQLPCAADGVGGSSSSTVRGDPGQGQGSLWLLARLRRRLPFTPVHDLSLPSGNFQSISCPCRPACVCRQGVGGRECDAGAGLGRSKGGAPLVPNGEQKKKELEGGGELVLAARFGSGGLILSNGSARVREGAPAGLQVQCKRQSGRCCRFAAVLVCQLELGEASVVLEKVLLLRLPRVPRRAGVRVRVVGSAHLVVGRAIVVVVSDVHRGVQ